MYLYLYSFGARVVKISVSIVGIYCGPPLSRTGLVPVCTPVVVSPPPPPLPPPRPPTILIIVHVLVQLSLYFYFSPQDGSARQST